MAQHAIVMQHPGASGATHKPQPIPWTKMERIPRAKFAEFVAGLTHKNRNTNSTAHSKPETLQCVEEPKRKKLTAPILEKYPDIVNKLAAALDRPADALDSVFRRAVVTDNTVYPWCCIGKVFCGYTLTADTKGVMLGTGVLVGPNLMLTASHVLPWGKPDPVVRFIPGYSNPNFNDPHEPFGSANVIQAYGVEVIDNVAGWDYVICELDTPLGNAAGWMGTVSWSDNDNYTNRSWISVGYPGDSFLGQVPMVELNLSVNDVEDDSGNDYKRLQTYQQYASDGWSGGPLWNFVWPGEPYVGGVLSGHEDDWVLWWGSIDDANAGGDSMVNLVKWGEANWPA